MLSRRAGWALAVPVAAVLVGYVLWPNVETFRLGLDGGLLADLFGRGRAAGTRALVNSVGVSLGTVALGGAVGTALAWALWRYDLPLRRTLGAVAALPLALPPLVGVLAFLFLYGESGMLPRALQAAFGLDEVPVSFGGVGAVLAVHVYVFYVYFYLFVGAALRDLDASLLDASADLGAGAWTTFRRVVLPLLRPALVGASLLVFMLSMASFTAPLLFAEGEPFLTTQIYQFKTNGALDRAAAVSVVLTGICLLFLVGAEARGVRAGGAGKGVGRRPGPLRGGARVVAGGLVGLALVVVLLPVATVVLLSFVEEGSWTTQVLPDTFTLANYAALATEPDVLAPITSSLWMAALATAANVVFGVATAVVIVKGRVPGRGVLRALSLLPFAVPGTVLALGLLVLFDEPTALAGGAVLIGTAWLLPLAYFVRHVPLVVRAAQASLESFDDRLAEASADLGAGGWATFRRIVLPAIGPGVVAGGLLTFVTALGEFVASIMLYVYANRPIAVEVFSQLRIFAFGQAAAYSVLLMALVALAVVASRRLGGRGVGM
ncbi:ABC transporter permease [Rubrivirga sp.]|uniref:ABC transporter permease n=1 Tax=Rubrivirga sp. TaxID=1885344 RepID=UPI003B52448E